MKRSFYLYLDCLSGECVALRRQAKPRGSCVQRLRAPQLNKRVQKHHLLTELVFFTSISFLLSSSALYSAYLDTARK